MPRAKQSKSRDIPVSDKPTTQNLRKRKDKEDEDKSVHREDAASSELVDKSKAKKQKISEMVECIAIKFMVPN